MSIGTRAWLALITVIGGIVLAPFAGAAASSRSPVAPVPRVSSYSLYGNGRWNDCTVAAMGDAEQTWNAQNGYYAGPLDPAPLLSLYRRLSPHNDGAPVQAALTAWQQAPIDGDRLTASAEVGIGRSAVESALHSGKEVLGVVALDALNALGESYAVGDMSGWTVANSPGPGLVANTHAMAIVGFGRSWLYVVIGGYVQPVSWGWWKAYGVDAWSLSLARSSTRATS
ncbi:MAG: hypothetical protein JWM85_3070 [Acidimicrobiaceae bacterium]|nr:hypothetical protein [Acidimicrobiaceae bacterium]